MRVFLFLIVRFCTLAAHADTQGTDTHSGQSDDREATQDIVQETPSEPEENGSDEAAQLAESPWQGAWTGSEIDTFGTRVSVTAKIKVTNGKISGNWRARGSGLRPITGQVNGKEASITILQGGSMIRAILVDKNKFEYSGMRGHGTLSRQEQRS